MSNTRKYAFYILFFLTVSVVFVYMLFPAQPVREYIQSNLQMAISELDVSIKSLNPVFPPGIRLNSTRIQQQGQDLLEIHQITLVPKLLSFFGQNNRFSFNGAACEGRFEGQIRLSMNNTTQPIEIKADFDGIQLTSIPVIERFAKRKISGLLSGNVIYNREDSVQGANGTLLLQNGGVDLLNPVFNINQIVFDKIETEFDFKDNRIQVKKFSLSGPQADGVLTGIIILKHPLETSMINLSGALKPKPSFLTDLTKNIPAYLVPKKLFEGKGAPITLNGTFQKPGFALR